MSNKYHQSSNSEYRNHQTYIRATSIMTPQETRIFSMLADYYTTKEIATMLGLTEKTIRNHVGNVCKKLGLENRTQAVLELIRRGEIRL